MRRGQQTFDHTPVAQVRLDDFIDVCLVDKGVPDRLGIDHGDRAGSAAVKTAGLVDPHLARTGQAQGFDTLFAMVECSMGTLLRTTGLA